MKAYCINLDTRTDRLEHMELLRSRVGLPFERVRAFDSNDPALASEAKRCVADSDSKRLSVGSYAVFKSHRACWSALVNSTDSHAMILEDDVVLADDIAQYLETAWIPLDADIVRLETYATRVHVDRTDGIPAGARRLKRLRSRHIGTAGYILARRTAADLLGRGIPSSWAVDEFLFNENSPVFGRLGIYQMIPAPVVQGDRLHRPAGHEGWIKNSIKERYLDEVPSGRGGNSGFSRFKKRLREEIRSIRLGTRYVVVPFG